jgi:dienelactone hydrolase
MHRQAKYVTLAAIIVSLVFWGCASAPIKETLVEADTGQIVFKSITIDDAVFYRGGTQGTEAKASGQLTFPDGKDKVPAVILVHGSNGVGPSERGWAKELNKLGLATFVVDSFSLRGISSTFTGTQSLGTGSSIVDGYRALELLQTHPRIDSSRIFLMGFSRGGRVTLDAAMERFQTQWLSNEASFVAYLAFYPAILVEFLDAMVVGKPIRIFQGGADDWTIAEKARKYIEHLQKAGQDAQIFEYPGAHHSFDNPMLSQAIFVQNAINHSKCRFREIDGEWIDAATHEPIGITASCFSRGATVGYDAAAHRQAIQDVTLFLRTVNNP